MLIVCKRCEHEKESTKSSQKQNICKDCFNIDARKYKQQVKDSVFEKYGGYTCKCCGETEKMFLSIDHIDGGAKGISSTDLYRIIKRDNYPTGYQILCHNCNLGKYMNDNKCPLKLMWLGQKIPTRKKAVTTETVVEKVIKPKKKYNKYHNLKVVTEDGLKFDSQKEYKRWIVLKDMEEKGEIHDLKRQIPFVLHCPSIDGDSKKVGKYISDFCYYVGDEYIVEDVKSFFTAKNSLFIWKKRHIREEYGIIIRIEI